MASEIEELLDGPFETLREALDSGGIRSLELCEQSLRRAKKDNTNSFISLTESLMYEMAEAADKTLKSDLPQNPAHGIPIGVKDLICVKGYKTTAASKMLENFVAPYDATVVRKIKTHRLPIVGKNNLDEFAMGSSNENSAFGVVKNPWDLSRVPGGSSGGSAAAVAARLVPFSLGTDTGGSIRQPSAMCGVTGLKPTYGRVSRYGVIAFASSLDQVGPIGVDAMACAALLEATSGHDPFDSTSANNIVEPFYEKTRQFRDRGELKGLKIGIPKEFFDQSLNSEVAGAVRDALDVFRDLGAKLVDVSLPNISHSIAVYYLICTSECSSNLARYDGIHYGYRSSNAREGDLVDIYCRSRGEGFGSEVKLRIMMGTYALSSGYYDAYYKKASQVRRLIAQDYEKVFAECDVVAGPTSPFTAFKFGEKLSDPLAMYLSDVFTLSTNLAAIPAISFNVGFDQAGLPIGLQLQGPWWQELRLLGMAAAYQKIRPESVRVPPQRGLP